VETSFIDTTDASAVAAAVRPSTRLIFVETPANPTLEESDIEAVAEIARQHEVLFAVDNTFLTAVLQRPLDLGADVSVYSTTKYIEGHSAALGGAVVARDEALLERIRFVRKCTGGIQAPFNAWLTLQGLKTLPVRLERQSTTAGTVAAWLDAHADVARVHSRGAILSFELDGGVDTARRFLRVLQLCRLVEHVGSVETLITHPATMTHADVPKPHRESVGVTDGLLRLSVGLEPADAIIADLEQAITHAREGEEVRPCVAVA
jgi:cystathionine beta-lyase/cystathionine gamma-synthase